MPHDNCLQYLKLIELKVILAQNSHTFTWFQFHTSGSWILIARQNLQKGRFTSTISANNTVTVS
ncbi:hypothetical protein D3C71_850980 [compost metagenome]